MTHEEVGACKEIMAVLKVGGESAVELVVSVLEHAADVVEGLC
eukprot:SAG11_NODE_2024_length_3908_cov_4.691783_3_plen_42_part_01